MAQNSLQIKSKSRHCENKWCKADISDLHGNAKHCDQRCWEIHQAIDYDKKWVRKLTWKREYTKQFLENNKFFLDHLEFEIYYWVKIECNEKVSFSFACSNMRYKKKWRYVFPNPILRDLKEALEKKCPEVMEYIK